jgi:hypothetical protein
LKPPSILARSTRQFLKSFSAADVRPAQNYSLSGAEGKRIKSRGPSPADKCGGSIRKIHDRCEAESDTFDAVLVSSGAPTE